MKVLSRETKNGILTVKVKDVDRDFVYLVDKFRDTNELLNEISKSISFENMRKAKKVHRMIKVMEDFDARD